MSARPALRALIDRAAAAPPTPGQARPTTPPRAKPVDRRVFFYERLQSDPTTSVGFVSYNWLEVITLFNPEEIIALLGEYVIRNCASDFLFRSEPGSDIERHIGRQATAELRASAILHLPSSQLILKYCRTLPLTWSPATGHPVLHPAAICSLFAVIRAMPRDAAEAKDLLAHLRTALLSLFDPLRGIDDAREILREVRRLRGNCEADSSILETIEEAHRRYEGRQRTLREWYELIESRLNA